MKDNSTAKIYRQAEGCYQIEGELDFDSVPIVLVESNRLFTEDQVDLEIDLAGVQRANSAALGLMLEWMQLAQRQNRKIQFRNVPEELLAIAHVSDLDTVLPIER